MNEYKYRDIDIGTREVFRKRVTKYDILKFSELTGDKNPLHLDEEYASGTKFERPVVYGFLLVSFLSKLVGMFLPGKYSLILSVESNFKEPCFENDLLLISGTVEKKMDFAKIIVINTQIENQDHKVVLIGKVHVQVLK